MKLPYYGYLFITLLMALAFNSYAQPAIQWQKVYGGSLVDYKTFSIDSTNDGGCIVAGAYGYSVDPRSFPGYIEYAYGFLIRFDASHNIVWKKNYTGDTSYNALFSVKHTLDGGFIATGTCNRDSGILTVKTNANGDTLWQKDFKYTGTPDNAQAQGNSVIQTSDGGYIVAGYIPYLTSTSAVVVKFNALGDTLWSKTYGNPGDGDYEQANSIKQTSDGGYIVAGVFATQNALHPGYFGHADYCIFKIDGTGNLQWQKLYGGSQYETATSISLTSDGGYIIGGYSNSNDNEVTGNHGGNDYWIVKTNSTGDLQWQKSLGGSQNDYPYDIRQATDGNYIITGYSSSNDGDVIGHHSGADPHADAWTLKLDNTGSIIWQNSTGTIYSEGARGIIQTSSGFTFAGTNNGKNYNTYGFSSGDIWLANLDANGNTTSQLIDSASGGYNFARSVVQTSDGFIVAGFGNSNNHDMTGNHNGFDGWVMKTDNSGTLQWTRSLGGSNDDYISSITKTPDGGYIAAGTSNSADGDVTINNGNSDFWIVKLSAAGSIQWQKSYGGSGYDSATSIQQTTDGGYIVAGRTSSNDINVSGNHGGYDVWIIKLDASGNLSWQKTFGGTGTDIAYSIRQTTDGGYIAAGSTSSADGDVTGYHAGNGTDFWIIKLNASGALTWQKCLGGTQYDQAYDIRQTIDGGYIAGGSTASHDGDVTASYGNYDLWITKLDALGNLTWQKTLGGSLNEEAFSIIQTNDGDYVVAGYSNSNDVTVTGNHGNNDYWLTKIDTSGNLLWEKLLGGSSFDVAYSLQQTADNGYILAGYTTSYDGDVTNNFGTYNYWLVKLAAEVLPVTLLNFDGVIKDNSALLSWSTSSEINNKGFEVQKSYDGRNFSTIGFVAGAGTSSLINKYNYTDIKVESGSNYYRLKQIDIDDKFTYSFAIKLDYSKFGWSILGNPVIKNTTVELQLDRQANVSLQLLTINGRVLQTINKGDIGAGTYSIPLDLSNQAAGSYVIRLLVNEKQYSQKIIKN